MNTSDHSNTKSCQSRSRISNQMRSMTTNGLVSRQLKIAQNAGPVCISERETSRKSKSIFCFKLLDVKPADVVVYMLYPVLKPCKAELKVGWERSPLETATKGGPIIAGAASLKYMNSCFTFSKTGACCPSPRTTSLGRVRHEPRKSTRRCLWTMTRRVPTGPTRKWM